MSVIAWVKEQLKPLASDDADEWELKEDRKAESMVALSDAYSALLADYSEVSGFLAANSTFTPNGLGAVLFDPLQVPAGSLLVFDGDTNTFISKTLDEVKPTASIRINTINDGLNSPHLNSQARVRATNLILDEVGGGGGTYLSPEIDVVVSMINDLVPGQPASSSYDRGGSLIDFTGVWAAYDSMADQMFFYCHNSDYLSKDFPTPGIEAILPANITHHTYVGMFLPDGTEAGSTMIDNVLYVGGEVGDTIETSLSFPGSTVDYNRTFQGQDGLPSNFTGLCEGHLDFAPSGSLSPTTGHANMRVIVNNQQLELGPSSTSSDVLAVASVPVQIPVSVSIEETHDLEFRLTNEWGTTGSMNITWNPDKFIFDKKGYLAR